MAIARKYQVFVSSTFEDLEEERRLVIEQILNMGHIPVGMELFQASNDEQWEYIRRRIDQCDYYIVIVAQRYGACSSDGMGYTEKEYRYACESKIPVAALLLSPKAQKTWPASKVQNDHADKLESFRQFCSAHKMVRFWDDSKDLALKATHALHGMIEDSPRPGLVPATEAASSGTIAELARLSDENNQLRKQLSRRDVTSLTSREEKLLAALRSTKTAQIFDKRDLNGLQIDRDCDVNELFFDIARGEADITHAETGDWVRVNLGINEGADTAAMERLGFVVNDRLCALGLLQAHATNSETFVISELGWKILREGFSPEEILKRW